MAISILTQQVNQALVFCLSSDTKPNGNDGWFLVEVDTGKIYWWTASAWVSSSDSALDPIATGKIEDLLQELKGEYTVIIVTHNMQQAARISDYTAFMFLGHLIEYGATVDMFTKPHRQETADYVTGRFG